MGKSLLNKKTERYADFVETENPQLSLFALLEDDREEESVTFVKFSPLVTESIQKNAFRLVNYQQLMSYKTTIARLLHKRMSHNFSQAAKNEVYHISTNTIYRDFGLKKLSNLGLQVIEIKKALGINRSKCCFVV